MSARLFVLDQPCRSLLVYAKWLDDRGLLRRYGGFFEQVRYSLEHEG